MLQHQSKCGGRVLIMNELTELKFNLQNITKNIYQ